jgi:hypothetical protein
MLDIDPDAVDLRRDLVHLRRPGAPTIERDVGATVVRLDHRLAVVRIDPDVVIVPVRRAERRERPAAIGGLEEALGAGVDDVGVGRVGT